MYDDIEIRTAANNYINGQNNFVVVWSIKRHIIVQNIDQIHGLWYKKSKPWNIKLSIFVHKIVAFLTLWCA